MATIGVIPEFIGKIAGQPYFHMEMIRTASGVLQSEALWINKDGKWIQRVPLLTRVSIPLDTTDCPTGNNNNNNNVSCSTRSVWFVKSITSTGSKPCFRST